MTTVSIILAEGVPAYSSFTIYAEQVARALDAVGIPSRIVRVPTRAGRRVGGVVGTLANFLLRSYARDGTIHHVVYHELGWRGSDVVTVNDLPGFYLAKESALGDRFLSHPIDRFILRRLLRRPGITLLAPAAWVAEELRRRGARDVVYIPNPRPTPAPAPYGRKDIDVLWVGVLRPNKGPVEFLRGLATVPRRLRVVFVAKKNAPYPEYIARVMQGADALAAQHDFTPIYTPLAQPEMDGYFQRAKVVVSTSTYEGFHLPPWEGYACGARLFLPESPIYRLTYGNAAGVTYYPPDEPASWGDRLISVVDAGPFVPDRAIVGALSYDTVGRQLADVYRRHAGSAK